MSWTIGFRVSVVCPQPSFAWYSKAAQTQKGSPACDRQWYTKREIGQKRSELYLRTFPSAGWGKSVGPRSTKRGLGKRHIDGKDFHLAEEIRYIQRRAAEHSGRFVTIESLVLHRDWDDGYSIRKSGSPMTYMWQGKQYIVIAVSGGNYSGE